LKVGNFGSSVNKINHTAIKVFEKR